ncbi:MAG: phosphate ABC transporter permease subunit PstC, partial [Chloroflexi bacterium]|nr:phosphate ABC transporter permease subunit PstC [Chloroflexota bacterium]
MDKSLNWRETIITAVVKTCGYSAIVFVILIFFFLLREGVPALAEIKLSDLLGTRWYPIENHFGILPLLTGSLIVTLG